MGWEMVWLGNGGGRFDDDWAMMIRMRIRIGGM